MEDTSNQWRVALRTASGKATVTLYSSGICTVAGRAAALDTAAEMVLTIIGESDAKDFLEDLVTNPQVALPTGPHIGSDESGKSDFFGPLVTAAVHADGELIKTLCALGVRDCKDLSDQRVSSLADEIYRIAGDGVAVTCLHPERYNELYSGFKRKGKTLNDLLAWAHSCCIKDLLARGSKPTSVLVDRFAYHPIQTLVQATDGGVPVLEVYTAEADFAVAAASIVARAKFLEWMEATSASLEIQLPKGTDSKGKVVDVARSIVKRDGAESLKGLAKLNVSTMVKVLALSGGEGRDNRITEGG